MAAEAMIYGEDFTQWGGPLDYDERKDLRKVVYRKQGVKRERTRKEGKTRGVKHFHSLRALLVRAYALRVRPLNTRFQHLP